MKVKIAKKNNERRGKMKEEETRIEKKREKRPKEKREQGES